MPSIQDMLSPEHPRCPNHPRMLAERFGVCCVCLMSTHRHLSGFKLITDPPAKVWGNTPPQRVAYRTEAEAYGEGLYDDD